MQSNQTNNSSGLVEEHPAPPVPSTSNVLRDTIAHSQSFFTDYLSSFPSADELDASILDAFNFDVQVPGFEFADPGTAQHDLEEDANNNNGNVHFAPDAPPPVPTEVNNLVVRNDATGIPQVRPTHDCALTSIGFYFIPRECLEVESIIPKMIHQKLVDLHVIPMHLTPFFHMPDTREYAQFTSNISKHKDAVTRQYYSKIPRNPCFPDDLKRQRIYPIELLKRLPNHLKRYKDAFPEPLPMVIIRDSEIICMDLPGWHNMHGITLRILPTSKNSENSEHPEDTLWSMSVKRGVSASYKPYIGTQQRIATSLVQFGNRTYSAEELTYFNFAVNVFLELPRPPGKEPTAAYKGAFILNVIDDPMDPACWTELSDDRKMDIHDRAPEMFDGLHLFLQCPHFPAVNLHFQNWDINLLGVLDDLKFGTVDVVNGVTVATNGN
ncbi:hypothetical protein EDB19DRAFT_105759 [Suillus lakei]|nr:hypothetical protein EDB19DRAFT_105759 [Suillus lakei]